MSWEENVRKVVPYVPGEQPKVEGSVIKLNTNEFPYPPSPKVEEALKNTDVNRFKLYPNVYGDPLREKIAEYYGFKKEEVFVGVGSDDVLSMIFLTFFNSDKPVLFPDVTYSFYDVWADVYRIPYVSLPLTEDFNINVSDYFRENGGIVIANPNAPTGIELPGKLEAIENIVKGNSGSVVVVDEAYVDFGATSALELVNKYDNLLVVQTFSKSRAFAGMRIGYAIGNEKLIKYLNDVKFSVNSYTMNQPSIIYGVAAIEDKDYFNETVAKVIATRERVRNELETLGFMCLESKTNFIFCSHQTIKAVDIFEYLKTQNIYVRHFKKPQRVENYLRISIGTDEEMDTLIEKLKQYLERN